MREAAYKLRFFFIVFLPVWIGGLIVDRMVEKGELFVKMNQHYNDFWDVFFTWETWLGNGLIFIIVVVLLFIKNKGWGIVGLIVFAFTALLPQVFKKLIFPDAPRPVRFFNGEVNLHIVEGVKQHLHHSFPSGHSTSIVGLMLLLTFLVKRKEWGLLFAVIALVTMYSRVYLAQHFIQDILAGAGLGFICAFAGITIYQKWIVPQPGLQKGLFEK